MNAKELLDAASAAVSVTRHETHGSLEDTFPRIASLWSSYLGANVTPTDVAAMMCMLKLVRAKAQAKCQDHWVDVAGYAAIGGQLGVRGEQMCKS